MVRHRRRCNTGICVYEASVEVQYLINTGICVYEASVEVQYRYMCICVHLLHRYKGLHMAGSADLRRCVPI